MHECQTSLGILTELPPVPEWKWISIYQPTPDLAISHKRHERWMASRQEAHTSHEVMLCLSGEHFYGFQGKVWKVTPGTVILVNKGAVHDGNYSPYQPNCRDLWLHLRAPYSFWANDIRNTRKKESNEVDQTFYLLSNARSFAQSACRAWQRMDEDPRNPMRFFQLQSAITSLLMETILYAAQPAVSTQCREHQADVINEIQAYIETNLAKKLSLEALADMAGYESVYFHRLFARYAGEPVHQFVNRKRLEKAKELLMEGYKIVSIAGALGFSSSTYFCRFFKRESGDTPSNWWNKEKKELV